MKRIWVLIKALKARENVNMCDMVHCNMNANECALCPFAQGNVNLRKVIGEIEDLMETEGDFA